MKAIIKYILLARRYLLMKLVPEFVWPRRVIIDGEIIQVRNSPYSFATRLLLVRGNYEMPERKLLQGIICPGDTVVEMGGSIGVLTAVMRTMAGSNGSVFSVEASAKLTGYSRKWLEQKGNVTVLTGFAFPVYHCQHVMEIDGFDESPGALAGIVSFKQRKEGSQQWKTQEDVYDLKTIAERFSITPKILVVDIEGSERVLLFDDMRLPAGLCYILMELHPRIYGEQQMKAIIDKMNQLGFPTESNEADVYLFKSRHYTRG